MITLTFNSSMVCWYFRRKTYISRPWLYDYKSLTSILGHNNIIRIIVLITHINHNIGIIYNQQPHFINYQPYPSQSMIHTLHCLPLLIWSSDLTNHPYDESRYDFSIWYIHYDRTFKTHCEWAYSTGSLLQSKGVLKGGFGEPVAVA